MKKSLILKSVVLVSICLAIGYISGITTANAIETWYAGLNKPSFTPPNWLFAPAWTTLYIMMGIAAAMVWEEGLHLAEVKTALSLFVIQLILNAAWSQLFFGMQNSALAMADIVLLFLAIYFCMTRFYRVRRIAGWMMAPYLLWVGYASVLNAAIVYLN